MIADELLDAWEVLPTPDGPGTLEAAEVAEGLGAWLALDHTEARHLLIEVPDGTDSPSVETKGMSMAVARHRVRGREAADYIDMACLDDAALETFAVVASDICSDLEAVAEDRRVSSVSETLSRWRWFWNVSGDSLSERDALGLFAELWFLDQWVGVSPDSVDAWTGADGARHDFQWPDHSIEVKATSRRADGAVVHTIQHLDQLADPETGTLYLFSLRVVRDRLAANTLPGLVDRCSGQLRGAGSARDSFLRKVSSRGYSPAHHRLHSTAYRILEEHLYEVVGEFPRLTAATFADGLPAGIGDVSYKLQMAACAPWLCATSAAEWQARPAAGVR